MHVTIYGKIEIMMLKRVFFSAQIHARAPIKLILHVCSILFVEIVKWSKVVT